jgi:FixJ family two-component response regulator
MTEEVRSRIASAKKKIFIVDDDASVCRALKCLLMTFGFAVETFLSGKSFFDTVKDTDLGCLILDIHLPGLDGWEVQRRLAAAGSKRPVIVMTADKNGGLRDQALQAGAVGFLQKPFTDQALLDIITGCG